MVDRSNPKLHDAALLDAIKNATIGELTFAEQTVPSHPELGEVKTGFKLTHVRGVAIPPGLRIAYLQSERAGALSWYVVSWIRDEARPHEFVLPSEDEARAGVLRELLLLLRRAD